MGTTLIHLSDIHYRSGWEENHGLVLRALFDDIREQKKRLGSNTLYAVLSGDVVQDGDKSEWYDDFLTICGSGLDSLGIPKDRRLCVPGNHDVSAARVEQSRVEHEGVVSQKLDETAVNDYCRNCHRVFSEKFAAYREFESQFSGFPALSASITGAGYELNSDIAVYCLNSALFSSGKLGGRNSELSNDKQRLAVETRNLNSWIAKTDAPCKILIMHHPLDWLPD